MKAAQISKRLIRPAVISMEAIMRRKKICIILYSVFIFIVFYSLSAIYSPPDKEPAAPGKTASGHAINPSAYYVITDESGLRELMRVRVTVNVGDEVLAEDNKLYEVIRVEDNHAFAKYVKQVKL